MFSATVTGSFCAASGWPSTLIRFLVAVFGGFPGNLDLPMFTCFQRRTSTSQRNSASILLAICAHGREAHRLSRTLYTDVRSPIIRARAHTHGHRGPLRRFGRHRPASAALGRGRKIRAYLSNREPELLRRATPLKCARAGAVATFADSSPFATNPSLGAIAIFSRTTFAELEPTIQLEI